MKSFNSKTTEDKFKELLEFYNKFQKDTTSTAKADELCSKAWHLIDWVYEEYKAVHLKSNIVDFRETLYPQCPSLKIMHDIVNSSKHYKVSRPKAFIKEAMKHEGTFSSEFSSEFDITTLAIELEDGSILYFDDEIEKVVIFWKSYFDKELNIKSNFN